MTKPGDLSRILKALDIAAPDSDRFIESIPFSSDDATAGAENEFQTAVLATKENADLSIAIKNSNYYKNLAKRVASGDTSKTLFSDLEQFLDNPEKVWENSWVRFPKNVLTPFARKVFRNDMLANKSNPSGPKRRDADKFHTTLKEEEYFRIPVSYMLKLALADVISISEGFISEIVRETGEKLLDKFLNDNTSPEIISFHIVNLSPANGMGKEIAKETAKRSLLTQLLVMYANIKFELRKNSQTVMIYSAPHPPTRLKRINEIISDSFYRELFLSPCLSGWDKGEEKNNYMILCHQTLSRSQLNAISKLREAGIISRELVTLPKMSNISLANNGVHVSLGSRILTRLLNKGEADFTANDEKRLGDLAIKIMEHFLPLFVGSYSSAPYRLDFKDFHPETVLGFLPHELDYTHLRMFWRRWRKKAKLKIFGQPVTPFGPKWLDGLTSLVFGLKGDFIPDFRLIDYPVALMSTHQSPALNGETGNESRLKQDLFDMGIFDERMSLYLPYKLREFQAMGFSGFEGRYYSLFENIVEDMGEAVSLQNLLAALAYKYILKGDVSHAHIPDDPFLESERRQPFFCSATQLPTFYVSVATRNRFLINILKKMKRTRMSSRYPGYIRCHTEEYRKALITTLKEDAADLIELFRLEEVISKLEKRVTEQEKYSAAGKLTRGIIKEAGVSSPMKLSGDDFNLAAEKYYRGSLRKKHIEEALELLSDDLMWIGAGAYLQTEPYAEAIHSIIGPRSGVNYLASIKEKIVSGRASLSLVAELIHLVLITIAYDMKRSDSYKDEKKTDESSRASIY